jgi:hypothetical protein
MKKLFIVLILLNSFKSYGQNIFRYVDIYPNGIIYLDSTLNVGRQFLIFKNDSIVELKEGVFGGCKNIIIQRNSKKRVKQILFYYSEDFNIAHYIAELKSSYHEPVISYQIIKVNKYKVYSWIDYKTILEFRELVKGTSIIRYACLLKSRNP